MLSRRARDVADARSWAISAPVLVAASVVACVAIVAALPPDRIDALSAILGVAAVAAGVLAVPSPKSFSLSASFIVTLLAAAMLGPVSAAATAIIAELSATARQRTPWRTVVFTNLPTAVVPSVAAAAIVGALSSTPTDSVSFYFAVVIAGLASVVIGFAIFSILHRMVEPNDEQPGLRTLLEYLPSAGLSILVAVAGVSITLKVGYGGIAFALAAVFAFSYMSYLLDQSRKRAQQYVSLSWGVLAGLMRSLDIRDQHAARHAAAVARFARDIAKAVGMDEAQCELAHTAGLLHDVGRFALSDRVAERGRTLTEEDWLAIQRHPELGADMLRDLGMYGPVAGIVLAHHERIDGRGYPSGLSEDEIPEIAKIISVAEVYDTLTASDTYRTQMSSFEALTELRRVAGSQLDGRYVEILAGLLTGVGMEYRHADMADFDVELDMERRIREASTGS